MTGISGISPVNYRSTVRMGTRNPDKANQPDPVTGQPTVDKLPPGPPIIRQRGERVQDPFRTPDLPPATEANEIRVLNAVRALFATELADPSKIDLTQETRHTHGQRQLGINVEYYYNHPDFIPQKSPEDTDHTMRHAYNRLLTLKDQGITINKEVPPTGIVANGIPVRLVMGHYLAPNEFVLGGGLICTTTDGQPFQASPINRKATDDSL